MLIVHEQIDSIQEFERGEKQSAILPLTHDLILSHSEQRGSSHMGPC